MRPSDLDDGGGYGDRVHELDHLPFGDFHLGSNRELVAWINSRAAATRQLRGAERREHHELKRTDAWWAMYQGCTSQRLW